MRHLLAPLLLSLACIAHAADDKKAGTVISFTAQASQAVRNDLARATMFAEATETNSSAVANKVNASIADAMTTAKTFASVKTHSGATWTSPVYGKEGRTIEAWHMRSELQLESENIAALGELVGKLQSTLGVSQMTLQPSPETRRKAEDQVTLDALNAFRDKAQRIASNFKKYYKVVRMNVESSNPGPVYPLARGAAMMKVDAAPMPIESGDSTVSVTVNGEIELVD